MGRVKTSRWQSAGIVLCAIAVAVCALLVAQVPQHAFAAELAAASGGHAAGGVAKAAPKAQGSSGLSAQEFDKEKTDIPENVEELQLGEGISVTAEEDEVKWFKFTPSESGLYRFYTTDAQSDDDDNGDDNGDEEEEDDDSSVDTFGCLYVVDGDKLSRIARNDDGSDDDANFSIRQMLTKDETYYLACSEYDDEEASFVVFVEECEFNPNDLCDYDWELTYSRIPSKDATSLDAVLEALQPYAVSPLNKDERIPYSDLSTAACYCEVDDEEADDYVEQEVVFPLEPGEEYYIKLMGEDPYDGTVSLSFEVVADDDFTQYSCSYSDLISVEEATSEAALVEALDIEFFDRDDNLVELAFGTDYSIEWYEGDFDEEEGGEPLLSFPNEPGNYSAKLISTINSDWDIVIMFELCNSNDLGLLDLCFKNPTYYFDGSEVSVEKLGGLGYESDDDESDDWVEAALKEGVDYDVTWVAFADEEDETGVVLESAPKDIGEYYGARLTATKGGTYSGTCDVDFSIVDPNDLENYCFRGVQTVRYTGNPVTIEQLELKAFRDDGIQADDVKFEVAGWCKVLYSDDDDEEPAIESVDPSKVVDPGVYRVMLKGSDPFEGDAEFDFVIAAENSLRLAEVSCVSRVYAYTGSPIAIEPVVKLNGATLVKGEDYELAIYCEGEDEDEDEYVTSVVDPGRYTIKINAIEGGHYVDWCEIDFQVKKFGSEDLSDDAIAAATVSNLIEELPETITSDAEKAKVDAAKAAFDALTDAQKDLVSADGKAKLDTAVTAAAQYIVDKDEAAGVEDLINALPKTVTSDEAKAQVDAAAAAFDALTDAQKKLVSADGKAKLDAAVDAATQYAVDKVEALIEPLPKTVASDADKAKVEAAVAAFDALTDLQKKLISEALKAKLDAAVASAQQYADAQEKKNQQAKANPMTVTAKAVKAKAKKLKKKAMKVAPAKAFAVGNPQGAVTYKLLKVKAKKKLQKQANKKIKVASDGTIKLGKKLKKGTYSLTVQVSAAGNASYKPASKTVTVKVKVK